MQTSAADISPQYRLSSYMHCNPWSDLLRLCRLVYLETSERRKLNDDRDTESSKCRRLKPLDVVVLTLLPSTGTSICTSARPLSDTSNHAVLTLWPHCLASRSPSMSTLETPISDARCGRRHHVSAHRTTRHTAIAHALAESIAQRYIRRGRGQRCEFPTTLQLSYTVASKSKRNLKMSTTREMTGVALITGGASGVSSRDVVLMFASSSSECFWR